jgi:hypothetical protein
MFVYRRVFVFSEGVSPKARLPMKKVAGLNVRLANSDDIWRLQSFRTFRQGKAEKRLTAGHLCFVAEKDRNIVGYSWIGFHEAYIDELEIRIRLSPCSAYKYDAFIVPTCRGVGVYPLISVECDDYLFQNGIKEAYGIVDSDNFSMLRSFQKVGNRRKIGEVTYIRLFHHRKYIFKGSTLEDRTKLP